MAPGAWEPQGVCVENYDITSTASSPEVPLSAPLPTFRLDGRVALVTGASSGLGARFAEVLAGAGAHVVLAARRVDALERHAEALRAAGGKASAVQMDVTSAASVAAAFDAALDAGGADTGTPDILVNNSGVATTSSVVDMTEDEWDQVLDTNLKGAWLVAREAARRMIATKTPGSIINIASITHERAARGLGAYAASKAGLAHLTRVMSLELARHNIRANAIAPGYILTDINRAFFETDAGKAMIKGVPQRRLGAPDDLDGVLLLLASDASRFMTGSVVSVDGGHTQAGIG